MSEQSNDIRRALSQTLADDQLNKQHLHDLAETMTDTEAEALREENIEAILLETLPDEQSDTADDTELNHESLNERTFFHKSEAEDHLNKAIIGRYQINAALSSDTIGQWFSLHDNNTDREIHVKFLKPDLTEDETVFNKFVNEARILAQLTHPGIPDVHEIDLTEGGLIYYTCAQYTGTSLQQLIDQCEIPGQQIPAAIRSYDDRVSIIKRICEAVACAHQHGVIHQDIKPDHIIIGTQHEVLLSGWLHACHQGAADRQIAGTPLYMSPEQARQETSDHLSDIYCLGSTFLYLLTLRPPLQSEPITQFWENKRRGDYQKASAQETEQIPLMLLHIAEKAMAADPQDRYQSVTDMIADLELFQQQQCERSPDFHHHAGASRLPAVAALLSIILCVAAAVAAWQLKKSGAIRADSLQAVSLSSWTHGDLSDLDTDWESFALQASDRHSRRLSESAAFSLTNGQLSLIAGKPATALHYKHQVSDNLKLSWTLHAGATATLDCFIAGTATQDAYCYHLSKNEQSLALTLSRAGVLIDQKDITVTAPPTAALQFTVSKKEDVIELIINNDSIHRYRDPYPLSGIRHSQFGFVLYPGMSLSNISLKRAPMAAWQTDTAIADNYYYEHDYSAALEYYQQLHTHSGNNDLKARAAYRIARCHSRLSAHQAASDAYRLFIQEHPQHELMPYATLYYIISLAQTRQWQLCDDTLQTLGSRLQPPGLRSHALNQLHMLTEQQDLHLTPALSALRKSISTLRASPR